MTKEEVDKLEALTAEYASKLGEHFDAVQILACACTGEGTRSFFKGSGNWYARQGMAKEFMTRDEAQTLAIGIGSEINKEGSA